jgi:outer membrane protein
MTARASVFMPASGKTARLIVSAITLGSLMGWYGNAKAQSLDTMIGAARQYDATYLSETAGARAAKAAAQIDGAVLNPKVSLTSTNQLGMVYGSQSNETISGNIGIVASHPLFNEKNQATSKKVAQGETSAIAALRAAEQSLIVRVAQAYFDVLTASEELVSVRASKQAAEQQLAAAQRNFEVGNTTITDSREAQAQFDRILADELVAQNNLAIKQLALTQVTGLPQPTPKGLATDNLPNLSMGGMDEWVKRAIDNNPSIVKARADLTNAALDVEIANAGLRPTVDLEAGLYQNHTSSARTSQNLASHKPTSNIAIKFNWPLYTGGAVDSGIRTAIEKEAKASADLEGAIRAVGNQVKGAYLGLQSGLGQTKALQAALVSSQSALDANKLGYEVGVRINIDVLNAQTVVFKTQASLAKARHEVLLSSLKLRQAAGVLDNGAVEMITRLLNK